MIKTEKVEADTREEKHIDVEKFLDGWLKGRKKEVPKLIEKDFMFGAEYAKFLKTFEESMWMLSNIKRSKEMK